jgi:spore coat polysaccharide biosynthesis protein SpsF
MKTIAIIQAHMGSSRLPGKVLLEIGGRTMLEHVIERTRQCPSIDEVVVATSTLTSDDVIADRCLRAGVSFYRGSDEDVLDRFTRAARQFAADHYVRITSDCPLLDPEVSEHIIQRYWRALPKVDYASNKIPFTYPPGLDTEIFSREALERAWRQATEAYERAHVTIHIYQHPEQFRLLSVTSDVDRSDWRWTVDTPEDLEFVRQVYARLGTVRRFTWRDVVSLIEREPSLREINRHVVTKPVNAG